MKKLVGKMLVAGAMAGMLGAAAQAQTATSQFNAQIIITADCLVSSPNTLDFGSSGLLNANVDAQMNFTVQCTNGTAYTIAMNDGANPTGTTNRMTNGTEFVSYELYQDSGRTTVWDATSTLTGTGTGSAVTHTVFGRVPVQPTPGQGTYTDTVTITVTY